MKISSCVVPALIASIYPYFDMGLLSCVACLFICLGESIFSPPIVNSLVALRSQIFVTLALYSRKNLRLRNRWGRYGWDDDW
ncbi:hypothetical protein H4Q26_007313 [Puccinia striiformis f. sp. tritici PST-130]|nr:hypothetical protein H4Q26_007313 [Puccinia striiformis f. sp. tritici PST-130]